MKVLYVAGTTAAGGDATTEQLTRIAPDLAITTVVSAAEALAETRGGAGFRALVTSPWLAPNETLALIVSLRRDRVPIAIVPVVAEAQRDFFASAVAAGADDVLLLRGDTLVRAQETLTRIRQSPHVTGAGSQYRLRVLYAGRDNTVWSLLEQISFVAPDRVSCTPDGGCQLRTAGTGGSALRCDAVLIDDPEEAHPLQVLKSIKSQESDLPVVLLTPANAGDIDTAALDLGADDTVPKNGVYRRRLIATLRRLHQRIEITTQHVALRARESRLRHIVETLPQGVGVIGEDGTTLAVNAAALPLFGIARPTDVVGRDFLGFVRPDQRDDVGAALRRISGGTAESIVCEIEGHDRVRRAIELRGVRLERDARGGRGVLAVLQPASRPAADADAAAMPAEEYQILLARLADVEAERDEWEASLRRERAAWDQAREELERRVARAELERTASADAEAAFVDAFTSERSTWDEARRSFETRIEALQSEVESRSAELALHAADRAAWEAARADLHARIEAAQALRAADRATIDALTGEAAERQREIGGWLSEIESLRQQLAHVQAEAETLKRSAADLERRDQQRQASDAERAQWDAAIRDLEQRLAEDARERQVSENRLRVAEAEAESARQAVRDLRHQLDVAITSWRDLQTEYESARNAAASAPETERALQALRRELRQAQDAHATERAAWDAHRRDLENRIDEGERLRHDLTERLGARDHHRLELEVRLDDAVRAQRDLEARLAAADGALQQLQQDHQPLVARLREGDAAFARERESWDAQRRDLETRIDESTRARHDLEARIDEATRARHDLETRVDEATRARHDLEARVNAANQSLEELRRDHQGLADRLRDADAARAATAAELDAARRRIASLEDQLRDTQQAREHADRARADIASAYGDLEARHRALEAARDGLAANLGALDEAAARAAAAEETLRATRDDLNRIVEGHAADRAAWEAERHDLVANLQSRVRERDDYERRLRQIEDVERDRLRLEDALHAARGELAALVAAQAGERSARERAQSELDSTRQALDQERARRAVLKDRLREIGRQADERRAALEAESTTRRAVEQQLADALRQLDAVAAGSRDERARLERSLAAATGERDRLLDSQLFGYGTCDAAGRLVRCNDTFARIFGYADAADAITRTAGSAFPPFSGREAFDERLTRDRRIDRVDARLRRGDGRSVQVIESARRLDGASGAVEVEHTVVDVTAFMALEDRLRHARRLEEVGTLAASMAPELLRVLDDVDRHGQTLVEAIATSDARRAPADAVVERTAAAAELARQLLAFSRKQVQPAEIVDLHGVVARGEPVWRRLIGSHVTFEMKAGARAPIAPNGDDLDQLITAMIVAARDVLPVGGRVVVETDRVDLDAVDIIGIDDATPGPRAVLAVTASGFGVERATMPPVASLIARRSGAFTRTSGDPGRSAAFEVYFPIVDRGV